MCRKSGLFCGQFQGQPFQGIHVAVDVTDVRCFFHNFALFVAR